MNDADMQRAKDALDQLSDDPTVRELARQRELSRANLTIIRSFERQEGRQEGRAEGLADGLAMGRVDGLRLAIESLCEGLPNVHPFLRYIAKDDVQYYFQAADLFVLPYKNLRSAGC